MQVLSSSICCVPLQTAAAGLGGWSNARPLQRHASVVHRIRKQGWLLTSVLALAVPGVSQYATATRPRQSTPIISFMLDILLADETVEVAVSWKMCCSDEAKAYM
jgi:hypothetical protein